MIKNKKSSKKIRKIKYLLLTKPRLLRGKKLGNEEMMMNDSFQEGLKLKWEHEYKGAIAKFQECMLVLGGESDPDVLFNIGVCQWRLGNHAQAKEALENALHINGNDPDAQKILDQIERLNIIPFVLPPNIKKSKQKKTMYQLTDFRKDAAILDANFLITFWNRDSKHFIKFIKKARKNYNLYTSVRVYREMTRIGAESRIDFQKIQVLLSSSLILIKINDSEIEKLEKQILGKYNRGKELKEAHGNRVYAWRNDLSLVLLLSRVKNPIRYIVTDDHGIQDIIQFLHPNRDNHYHIRPNNVFRISVGQYCSVHSKANWEKKMYENIAK